MTRVALDLKLSADDLKRLEEIFAPGEIVGTRYDEAQMRMLDSQRAH